MFRNYLLISLRSIRKHLTYSMINVLGLGLGLAICLLLVTWIKHELSYDRFNEHADRIYRASMEYSFGGQTAKTSVSPTALLPVLEKNFAEVENGVRVYNPSSWNPYIVKQGDKLFQETKLFYADSTFFQIFSYKLLKGDRNSLLREPRSIVLTESMARKYFDSDDVVGKILQINNNDNYTITGLMEDAPSNSLLQFDFIASFSSLEAAKEQIWWSANYETFILLNEKTNLKSLADKTNALVAKELASELTNTGDYVKYNFIPLTDIYLRSEMNESAHVGDIQYVYIFGAIALLVLIIASINYVNLATAKAADRAKEVGIRKVVGALRNQLFFQFIGESVIITLLGLMLAFILASLALPLFNEITGKHFLTGAILNLQFVVVSTMAALLLGVAAGAYPAIAMTGFKPVSVLKGSFKSSSKGIWLRQSLVVFQFGISIILIVGTIVIVKQVDFIQNKKLGFEKENTIAIPLDNKTTGIYNQIKTEIIRKGLATQVGRATESPTNINGGYSLNLEGTGSDRGMIVTAMSVDADFIPALGMDIKQGRNYQESDFKKVKSDTLYSFILNEEACKQLSITSEKAVGTKVTMNGRKGEITAVVGDFHFKSLHERITPLVLFNDDENYSYIFVKLKPGNVQASVNGVKEIFASLASHRPFEYKFLDEQFGYLHANELRMTRISSIFASLTIIIACLGLVGLVTYTASQKIKEIGIRKVLGASVSGIILLITKDFIKLVGIAILIGIPAAWYIMEYFWLSDFVYRTAIGIWPLAIAALACIFIAVAAAGFQATKAALINPVDTLRNE